MDLLLSVIGGFFVELVFYGLFYAIGWTFLKVVTLGRHPGPWRGAEGFVDMELVALTGLLVTVAGIVIVWQCVKP